MKWLLFVIAMAIGATAAFFLQTTDSSLTAARGASNAVRDQSRAITATLGAVRTGQIAYVAQGQGDAFWMTRVTRLLPVLEQQLSDLKSSLSSVAAQTEFEPTVAAFENFKRLDARAQADVKGGDVLMASDLIFSDGLESTATISSHLEAAISEELQARDAAIGALHKRELAVAGGAAGGLLLVLLVMAAIGPKEMVADTVLDIAPVAEKAPVESAAVIRHSTLMDAAKVCSEFARVTDSAQLPALLQRAANVLGASGIIVWMSDQDQELRPAMAYGYPDQVISKMGSIQRDATNAVAGAFRSGRIRTVSGEGKANGALVAPLVTADGCVGVLSAEMKGGSEREERSQALASIFAAQLATLVTPPPPAEAIPQAAHA